MDAIIMIIGAVCSVIWILAQLGSLINKRK